MSLFYTVKVYRAGIRYGIGENVFINHPMCIVYVYTFRNLDIFATFCRFIILSQMEINLLFK